MPTHSPCCACSSFLYSSFCCSMAMATRQAGDWPRSAFAVATVTDRIDGEVARRRGLVTDLGKIADPIADKALIGAALVTLSLLGDSNKPNRLMPKVKLKPRATSASMTLLIKP